MIDLVFSRGMRVIESASALQDTQERLFPASRHRSARVRKKLIQRLGGEFRKAPCAFQCGNTLVVHPAIAVQLRREICKTTERFLMGGRL